MNHHFRLFLSLVAVLTLVTIRPGPAFAQGPTGAATHDAGLQALASRFFRWRATVQPCSGDDVPRVERPAGWIPPVSPDDLRNQRRIYTEFKFMLGQLPRDGWTRTDSVDYLLLRAAIERVNWELNVLKTPFRNPEFYVQQTIGALYELLVKSSPVTDQRAENIIGRIASIPSTLRYARTNLTEPVQPFARLAVGECADSRARLYRVAAGLQPLIRPDNQILLTAAIDSAAAAIESFDAYLQAGIPSMAAQFNPGKDAYAWYLKNVALIPLSTSEILTVGKHELDRAVVAETMERVRDAGMPELKLFPAAADQIEQSRLDELAIRKFLEDHDLLTIPSWLKHYKNRVMPPSVDVLSFVGETDDLTSETRRDEDGVSYIPPPTPGLSFFRDASARDPRPIIIHEGVPGHYCQLCLSWANEDTIRRHYIDSGPIEGWGFYVEEMLLQAGLFDADRPQTRQTIYRFMRLRALRVEADVRLAVGEFTIRDAAAFLEKNVPMDAETALEEAARFAANPGQGISYQIGKVQIEGFLKDARLAKGAGFNLREFYDYIVKNGNVPVALLRWEYLGVRDGIDSLWAE